METIISVLLIITLIVSVGNLAYMTGVLVPGYVGDLNNRLSRIETGIIGKELFAGETELYAKAKEEGTFILYTLMDVEDTVILLQEFSKRYPDITTKYWQGETAEIVAKVSQEYTAEQESVDVIIGDSATKLLQPTGAITPYETVQLDLLISRDPETPAAELDPFVIAYNTNLLAEEDAPENWEDLTDPKYKGMVAQYDPTLGRVGTYLLGMLRESWDDSEKFNNFVKGLKANEPVLYSSTGTMIRLVTSGEFAMVFPVFAHDAVREVLDGAPVDYVKTVSPVCLFQSYMGIYALAPHPNAAKLFIEWQLSIEGQLTYAGMGRATNRLGVPSLLAVETIFPGAEEFVSPTEEFLAAPKEYADQWITPIWEDA